MDQAISKLLEIGGPAGAIAIIMGFFIWYLVRQRDKMINDRIQDSKEQTATSAKLANAIVSMTDKNSAKMDVLKDAIKDLKYQVESLKDMIRNMGSK